MFLLSLDYSVAVFSGLMGFVFSTLIIKSIISNCEGF